MVGEDNKQSCTLDVIHQKVRNFFSREMAILFPVKREMAILFFVKRDLDPPPPTLPPSWKSDAQTNNLNLCPLTESEEIRFTLGLHD